MPLARFRRRLRPQRYSRVNRLTLTIKHNMGVKFVKHPRIFPWGRRRLARALRGSGLRVIEAMPATHSAGITFQILHTGSPGFHRLWRNAASIGEGPKISRPALRE